ncbi:amino acid adenylation domain-containing protein [Streptosporangium longisporum]|uniref:amino acid adenylation domain-containing protein n=1 Tax=Streptosporangium longisporum TaxID=46187 RepID=UPI0031E945A4
MSFAFEAVRERARTDGEACALDDLADGSTLSYAALIGRVEETADRLRSVGVGAEQPVAVLLGRSAETVVAMLAVLAAGGTYCPIDPALPLARMEALTRELEALVTISREGLTCSGGRATPAAKPFSPDAPAYVLHTSGSTGVPKGVAMPYRGLDRLIRWQIADGEPGLRTLHLTATSFDVTFQEVLSTLATGGRLVIAPEETRRDSRALLDTIVNRRIQRLFLPYVALQLLAETSARTGVVPDCLRHVVTAGERLLITPAIRDFFTALGDCRLDNHFGPTEAHLVTSLTLRGDPGSWPALPAIGTPVDGVACRVLDDRLEAVPDGEVGELYVAGDCLARGYHRAPVATAERFVASPWGSERLYRTGDLVRRSADGTYHFAGRSDDQLKIRGFRVEPGEVEHALVGHPRVVTAAVGLREVLGGIPVLVAYVQTAGPLSPREVTDHVRGLLPEYMIPSRVVTVESMPRTTSGKIDRAALAELPLPELAAGPAQDLSGLITDLWVRVLGHDDFAADDDFFDVGGDSLLATWVVAELGQAIGRPVELSVLLDASTVEDLAAALGADGPVTAVERHPTRIVTVRQGPSARSLYLVHPLGGELLGYRELARASQAPVRMLGIGWSGKPPAFGLSLSEIAETHVEQLRTVQPDGPYLLAGWSFGGVLAYEIAQQLTAAGAVVDFLGLLDANPVIDPITGLPIARTPFLSLLDEVVARLDDGAGAELEELTSGETWIQLMGTSIAEGASGDHLRATLDTARACMAAAAAYRPRPYAGPVHLFQASGFQESGTDAPRQARAAEALRDLCTGPFTVVPVPGDHWGIMRAEHVSQTAKELDAALERQGSAHNES